MEGSIANSNTGSLSERITAVEERVQFNSDTTDDIWESIEKVDLEIKDIENNLSDWVESELNKLYNIVNDNPLGN